MSRDSSRAGVWTHGVAAESESCTSCCTESTQQKILLLQKGVGYSNEQLPLADHQCELFLKGRKLPADRALCADVVNSSCILPVGIIPILLLRAEQHLTIQAAPPHVLCPTAMPEISTRVQSLEVNPLPHANAFSGPHTTCLHSDTGIHELERSNTSRHRGKVPCRNGRTMCQRSFLILLALWANSILTQEMTTSSQHRCYVKLEVP